MNRLDYFTAALLLMVVYFVTLGAFIDNEGVIVVGVLTGLLNVALQGFGRV